MTITVAGDTPDWLPDSSASVDNIVPLRTFTLDTGGQPEFTEVITVGKSYKSLYLLFFAPTHTGVYTVTIAAKDASANIYWSQTYSWSLLALGIRRFAVPIPCTTGGLLSVFVIGGTLGDTVQMALYGGTDQRVGNGPLYRPDGRLYPIGLQAAQGTNVAGGTVISAPGAGSHILIATLELFVQSTANNGAVLTVAGTINGTSVNLGQLGLGANTTSNNGGRSVNVPPGGILLDDNTALTYSVVGGIGLVNVAVLYDTVF